MKLNKLIINNVGPYKGEHIINFDELSNSLFLITGPTGSGKSYIFDSICCALYGKTSGDNRKTDDLKSKYASIDDTASVELEFEYCGTKYYIKREPAQIKTMKRGGGIKEYNATAELKYGETVLTKNVDKKIQEIIGLSYDDFKMTMMIAQGDFYSLINTETKKRVEIFRKILNTKKLSDFTEKVKERCTVAANNLKETETLLMNVRSRFDFDSELNEKLKNELEVISSLLPLIDNALTDEEDKVKLASDNYDNAKNVLSKLQEEYTKAETDNKNAKLYIDEKLNNDNLKSMELSFKEKETKYELGKKAKDVSSKYDIYKLNIDEKTTIKTSIESKSKELESAVVALALAEKNNEKKNALLSNNQKIAIEINTLNVKKDKLDAYKNLKVELQEKEIEISKIDESIRLKNDEKNKLQEKIDNAKDDSNLPSVDGDIEKKNAEIDNINKIINNLKSKQKLINDYLDENKKYIDLIKKRNELSEIEKNSYNDFSKYEKMYHESIAGILAKDLNEGEACPVCGSIHHIKKAILKEDISKELLNRKKFQYEEDHKNNEDISNQLSVSETKIEEFKKQINEFITEYDVNNIEDKYKQLLSSKEKSKEPYLTEIKKLEEIRKKKENAIKTIDDANVKLKEIDDEISEINGNKNKIELEKSAIEGKISSNSDLEGLKSEDIIIEINDFSNQQDLNKKEIERIEKQYNDSKTLVDSLNAEIKTLNEQLSTTEEKILSSKVELENKLKETGFENIEFAQASLINDFELAQYEKEINEYNINLNTSNNLIEKYIKLEYDKLTEKELDEIQLKVDNALGELNRCEDEKTTIFSKHQSNKLCLNELNGLLKKNADALNKYKAIEKIRNVATGNVSGNKVNFEVYYQLQVFDEILKFASLKFNKMTDGRFELLPGKPLGHGAQIGLEIDVKDLFNGGIRPVSGLSGGESFQASMSLALAFSEIIQLKAGGVELNSMFIDEGFGTLDHDMLDSTKKTLLEVGKDTDRRIGIISHIDELEKSIQSKIVVKKTDKGSSFNIINE